MLPPVVHRIWSFKVVLTSRNTLKILNTIKPVTRALTLKDRVRANRVVEYPQLGTPSWSEEMCAEQLPASQVTKSNKN